MNITCTGVRDGEWLCAATNATQTKGTVMQVRLRHGTVFPPRDKDVSKLTDAMIRDQFNHVEFFEKMTTNERKNWIYKHKTTKDLYLSDIEGLEIKFEAISGEFLTLLTSEDMARFVDGKFHPIEEVYRAIPTKKTGSTARRHTLIFRGGNWMVVNKRKLDSANDFSKMKVDFYCNLLTGEFSKEDKYPQYKNRYLVVVEEKKKGVFIDPGDKPATMADFPLIGEETSQASPVKAIIDWFTPSLYKSILQKLIRTRCKKVSIPISLQRLHQNRTRSDQDGDMKNEESCQFPTEFTAEEVFRVSFLLLVFHPGAFVPNIQRFVSGRESGFKRLGVSITEDAFSSSANHIISLFGIALTIQQHSQYFPSKELIDRAMEVGLAAQQDEKWFDYNWKTVSSHPTGNWLVAWKLLSTLRSFESDIKLVQSIGVNQGRVRTLPVIPAMEVMPIEHCVDQHSLTEIAHFFPLRKETFVERFARIWKHRTGINGRQTDFNSYANGSTMIQEITEAQRLFWIAKTSPLESRVPLPILSQGEGSVGESCEIHESWIAGLVGIIEVFVERMKIWVFIHPEDIYRLVALRSPSRDHAAEELDIEIKEKAIAIGRSRLRAGLAINNAFLKLKDVEIKLLEDESNNNAPYYTCNNVPWNEFIQSEVVLPIHPVPSDLKISKDSGLFSIENAFLYKGDGILEGAWQYLDQILNSLWNRKSSASPSSSTPTSGGKAGQSHEGKEILSRISMYIRPISRSVGIYKIARDGSSTYLSVHWTDTGVFQFLCNVAILFPGICSMNSHNLEFEVLHFPIWNKIRHRILSFQKERISISYSSLPTIVGSKSAGDGFAATVNPWAKVNYSEQRTLRTHQVLATDQIKSRFEGNNRGSLIWMEVGQGKTLIVTAVIGWLLSTGQMPEYCIYTLPPSAVNNVIQEFAFANLPTHLLDFRQDASPTKKTFLPGKINFIWHDHLRLAANELRQIASNSLFIIDEFHLTLNMTQRTSMALELAKLSWNFIGMSGTLIRDNSPDGIIEWVSQIVSFEVTPKNYWVAIGALISRKVYLGIEEKREFIEVPMSGSEANYYQNELVDARFGGKRFETNFREAVAYCYEIVYKALLTKTLELTADNRSKTSIADKDSIFVVCKDKAYAERMYNELTSSKHGRRVFLIDGDHSIVYTSLETGDESTSSSDDSGSNDNDSDNMDSDSDILEDSSDDGDDDEEQSPKSKKQKSSSGAAASVKPSKKTSKVKPKSKKASLKKAPTAQTPKVNQNTLFYDVIITTPRHSTGYTLTRCNKMLTSVYFSNQATRDQLDGRILRMGQKAKQCFFYILHTGILSYTLEHYEQARSINKALKDLADKV